MRVSLLTVVLALLFTGCRVHQVCLCPQPPVEIESVYHNDREGVEVQKSWWKEFNSPGLDQAMEQALADNLDLKQSWDRLYQACAAATIAGSERFPQMNIANQYQHTDSWGAIASTGTGTTSSSSLSIGSTNRYFLTPTLNYEIDIWQRVCSRYRAANWEVEASRQDISSTSLILSGNVAEVWFTILEQLGLLKVLKTQLEVSETLLELVELRFSVGQSSALDVYQQRLQYTGIESEIPPVESQYETSIYRLQVLMGQSPGSLELPTDPGLLDYLPPFPELHQPFDLLCRRPDLRAAFDRVVSADYEVAAAIADRFPKLTLALSYQFSAKTIHDLFDREIFSLIADLLTPVIDGGRRRAEVRRRHAIVCERLHAFGQAYLVALQEVEQAIVREKYLLQLIEKTKQEIAIAEQNLLEARTRYASGLDDYLTVIAAVQSLQNLQRGIVNEQKQLLVNRATLYRALGGPM